MNFWGLKIFIISVVVLILGNFSMWLADRDFGARHEITGTVAQILILAIMFEFLLYYERNNRNH